MGLTKTMAVSKQYGKYENGVFTANSDPAISESIVVNIVESNPDSGSAAVIISSDKYGWSIQGDFSNDVDAASGDSITVDTGNGVSAPFTTIVNGNGKEITFNSSTTSTANKAAVYSISKGGDGGRGGSYYLGGDGKKGGKGGDASDAEIQVNHLKINIESTQNKGSIGVLALSQGGNGGKGGGSYTIAAGGGNGGGGGLGKNAYADVKTTDIYIKDNNSSGIAAISAAGNGGNGGNAGGIVSSGGRGNTAGQAGAVSVTTDNATRIEIVGHNSNGILAQSVAGAGGNGGSSIGLAALGGNGGMGGNANTSTVNSEAEIIITGNNSYAITAQSIGGGGGNGGSTVGAVSLGAAGKAGGDGSTVTVVNQGKLQIKGDSSYGILAQSIGGGGGNAGLSAGLVGIGGRGGSGGTAGEVEVRNTSSGDITTLGKNGHGIVAQSIGGGGGNGGLTIGAGLVGVAIGGDGGAGNDSDKVKVENDANITTGKENNKTLSDNSVAILAQSIGGGGGNGSLAISGGAGFSLAVGGSGAGGGKAGVVEVEVGKNATTEHKTELTTWGNNSSAIKAQSIGGGGGNGGVAISANIGVTGVGASIALGGSGGTGAESSKVNVTTSKNTIISTHGDRSTGITAQSIGGAGGDGGMAIAAGVSVGTAINIGLGGSGGSGAKSGNVEVKNDAIITTEGLDSTGILAQSIGGSGGTGGLSVAIGAGATSASFALGGNGAVGGTSKEAKITNTAGILTKGDGSSAIVSQSIGGEGGNAGGSIAGSIGGISLALGPGALGGVGGNAGNVIIDSKANLETRGHNATAVIAQSIGGAGGNGGFSVAASASGIAGASLALGGKGGGGGSSSTVDVTLLSDESRALIEENTRILTESNNLSEADKKRLITTTNQSIAQLVNPKLITTIGDNSSGVLAQSIGGSGGNGGTSIAASANGNITGGGALSLAFGGKGGTGGTAGKVNLISDHKIQTLGQSSSAIVAQSIGGSGGNGGTSVAAAASGSSGPVSVSASIAIGGQAGAGAIANTVSVTNYGDLFTQGDHSKGIVAQSIGGNGGNGGLAIGASVAGGATGAVALSSAVGGDGGTANVADSVTVDNFGDITTQGDFAHGILAQSINGNGGAGGISVGASIAGSGDKALAATVTLGGKGGDIASQTEYKNKVTVNNSNNSIKTTGNFSDGISAQSIGGNGGVGGLTVGAAAAGSANMAAGIAVGLGGEGGTGGVAGTVTVQNINALIQTVGTSSHGINAQSIGGNGGNGGLAVAGSIAISKDTAAALSASVGGSGGSGNKASDVTVISDNIKHVQNSVSIAEHEKDLTAKYISSILTQNDSSNGINAQSIGGGGGNGGLAGSFSIAGSLNNAVTAAVAIGGSGGSGGSASNVKVESSDNITTLGQDSNAILAQSIGGGGGNGGTAVAGTLTVSAGAEGGAYSANVSLGGQGGSGNSAGTVNVDSLGTLITFGDSSHGVLAQSIGGGGGNGGMSIAATLTASRDSSMQASVAIGGKGGVGGMANTVTVLREAEGEIYTFGDSATGITAQSIGGGGGNGGSAISLTGSLLDTTSVAFALGGSGGRGNEAGEVNVLNKSNIYTLGDQAQAIKAQSIGGGGGNGGSSVAISATAFTKDSATNVAASVGGFGGTGNLSKLVDVKNQANLFTKGYGSQGILAQSIGGGGGNGGSSYSGTFNPGGFLNNESSATTLAASVGGFGGSGNNSGVVKVESTGEYIYTLGEFSSAIQAQSIGGGGGNGGNSTTKALSLQCDSGCDIDDPNAESDTNISLSVGGFGGNANIGNKVEVTNSSELRTKGDGSNGIYAQSIGGGGGDGGNALVDASSFNINSRESNSHSMTLAVGGYKGTAANADEVKITNSASIYTEGLNAKGILAQSIGGGGGNGGNAFGATVGVGGGALQQEIAVGVSAIAGLLGETVDTSGITGSAGDAGTVEITTRRSVLADEIFSIITKGAYSDAIFAQSIGGGGGIGGSASGKLAIGGGAGAGGDAKAVTINNQIDLMTLGESSRGIIAQSIGGGGGAGGNVTGESTVGIGGSGSSAGHGGTVKVINDAIIVTKGYGSEGILAQSIGGGGGIGGSVEQATVAIGGGALENILNRIGVPTFTANGGHSDKVTVNNLENAVIQTESNDSAAIVAQSISGGGGKGGNATGTLSLGGFGSNAGESGEVFVTNEANLKTKGTNSAGIIAQSIGGGGGIGGHASGTLGIGGFGSLGGKSGVVTVQNSGQISTSKVDSTAILAQSIAGGGGLGGGASASVAIGGFGGDGADSGNVNVQNAGNLFTKGRNASAIVAQSISGGGGKGGSSDGGVVTKEANTTTIESAYVAIGGNGAGAGDAGDVKVNNTADYIVTNDHQSKGIVAQSIAGGGGMGGEANGIDVSDIINDNTQNVLATFDQGAAAAGLGNGAIYSVHNLSNKLASGLSSAANTIIGVLSTPLELYYKNLASPSNGGSSGKVVLTNAANSIIRTSGNGSEAMAAQSIAGGGGTTGSAKGLLVSGAYNGGAGDSDLITASNSGILLTEGEHSSAIVAQSISGGGGLTSGLDNISSYAVLGGEGASGQSGKVKVNNDNILYTAGKLSSAIVAQSITGGGGIIGLSHYLEFGNVVDASINDAGQANDVEAISTGFITTEGDGAVAIVAQSIGGGGGYAAGVDQDNSPNNNVSNTAKGDAGDVIIKLGPMPVVALSQQTQPNNDPDDDSVAITPIKKVASIYTAGNYAHGIIAQSLAGGGGYANLIDSDGNISGFFSGTVGGQGEAGNVSIALDGRIITSGEGSIGVLAQSAGSQNGNIEIDIAKDTVIIGGSGNGAALALYDGKDNTVLNKGYLTGTGTINSHYVNDDIRLERVGYSDSFAIIGDNSSNTITNDGGFITGSIYLPDGSSTLINQNNGWVLTGQLMQFSNEPNPTSRMMFRNTTPQVGQVINDANWSIGGVDEISSTHVVGDFTQLSSGVFYLDYNADRNSGNAGDLGRMMTMSSTNSTIGTYDTMDVSGSVNLDGTIAINVMNSGLVTPGDFNLGFINANELNLSNSLQLVFLPSAISRYNLQNNGNGGMSLLSNYNYIQDGLTPNGVRMGDVINRIQTVQNTPAFESIANVIYYSPDLETLQANYNAISGEGSAAIHQSAFTLVNDSVNDISTQMDFWRSKSNLVKTNSSVALTCSSEDASGSSRADVKNCQDSNKWRLWVAGNDGHQTLSGKSRDGIADVTSNSNRLMVALDYEIDPSTLIGAAFVDGKARYEIKDRASTGTVESTGVTFFGIKDFEQYYVKGMLGYDWLKATTTRDIYLKGNDQATPPVADIQNRVEADFKGGMLTTRLEAGYKYLVDGINVTPFVGAQFAMTQYDGTTEKETTGASTDIGLKYERNRNYSAPLFVGVQFDKNYELNMGVLQPYARFSLNHDLSTDREVEANFVSAPGYLFTINGGEPQKTSVDVNLGFKMNTKANVSLFGQYNGKFSSSSSKTDHVNFGLEYTW